MTYKWQDTHTITKQDWESLDPYAKGYWVYLLGARKDQPNVPESYEPTEIEAAEYHAGQQRAVQSVQDNP